MLVYLDTRGHSKDLSRQAPEGVRFSAHTEAGVVELVVEPDGAWAINYGPPLNEAGEYQEIVSGTRAVEGIVLVRRREIPTTPAPQLIVEESPLVVGGMESDSER